ncbi:FecR family protein [Allosphingosinicella deserti]|nr:FecR domain-containing protein [Sphingomonas deserti]
MTEQKLLTVRDEAIAWHLRLKEGSTEDWDAFMAWLEADPARSDAYDEVKFADAAITAEMVPAAAIPVAAILGAAIPDAANDEGEAGWRPAHGRWRWATALAAIAAIFLIGLISIQSFTRGASKYEVATGPGERRTIALGTGDSFMLNGDTRLILDPSDPRSAEIAAGEATFVIRHDEARPFVVTAGRHRVIDVGTVFNVARDDRRFAVEVIEGAVAYRRAGTDVALSAGQTLETGDDPGAGVRTGRRRPEEMAGWRRGRLSYSAAPLERVARDLSRTLGTRVIVDPAVAALPFTGSLRVDRDARESVDTLAATLDLRVRRAGDGLRIEPGPGAPR